MTLMPPTRTLAAKAGLAWASRYPRPRDAAAPGSLSPWLVYPSLLAAALLLWFMLGELILVMWRLPFP